MYLRDAQQPGGQSDASVPSKGRGRVVSVQSGLTIPLESSWSDE